MKKAFGVIAVIVIVAVAIAIYYRQTETPAPPVPATVAEAPQEPAEPAIRHPVPEDASVAASLPRLEESDSAVSAALNGLWGTAGTGIFRTDTFIRRVVATVDNLPRHKAAERLRPLQPAPGQFRTAEAGDALTVRADNAARYATYMRLTKAIDSEKLVGAYVRFYPLFQQAYEELGYPGSYFNDRLIQVVDHLLAAPDMPAQVRLVQPKVFYEFAEPELESRSAGEKIMMRIGPENAAVVKAKLREIRAALVAFEAKP
jgi:hypothetical protein